MDLTWVTFYDIIWRRNEQCLLCLIFTIQKGESVMQISHVLIYLQHLSEKRIFTDICLRSIFVNSCVNLGLDKPHQKSFCLQFCSERPFSHSQLDKILHLSDKKKEYGICI